MDCGQKRKCLFKSKNNASCRNLDVSHVLLFLRTSKWMFTYGKQYPKSLQHINSSFLKVLCDFLKILLWYRLNPSFAICIKVFFRNREYFIQSYQESIQNMSFVFSVYQLAYNNYRILQNCVGMKKEFTCLFKYICMECVTGKALSLWYINMHFDMQN